MLFNLIEAATLQEVRAWVSASQYGSMLTVHAEIKEEIESARRKEQNFRKSLEEAMRKGIQFQSTP
jgi:hypothetical protein